MYHKDDADCKIFLLGAKEGIFFFLRKNLHSKAIGRRMIAAMQDNMMRMACFMRAKVQLYVETTKDFL